MPAGSSVKEVGALLNDPSRPLKDRFRALFTLRNLGGQEAIDSIGQCLQDSSALLKHECAYCLGQMQDTYSIPVLISVLKDKKQEAMVRHEAGEALGAIGSSEVLGVLREYSKDSQIEVAETCQLAIQRIEWLQRSAENTNELSVNPFNSVDPAPATKDKTTEELKSVLLDETLPLFERYRAMFSLRNKQDEESVLALAEGLKAKSALFRHEIAYVLGQVQHEASVPHLVECLELMDENPMVRHECAEALGSIAKEECKEVLQKFLRDQERVVKESCIVALDIADSEQAQEFQYANTLQEIKQAAAK